MRVEVRQMKAHNWPAIAVHKPRRGVSTRVIDGKTYSVSSNTQLSEILEF